jgi:hypothetical protein
MTGTSLQIPRSITLPIVMVLVVASSSVCGPQRSHPGPDHPVTAVVELSDRPVVEQNPITRAIADSAPGDGQRAGQRGFPKPANANPSPYVVAARGFYISVGGVDWVTVADAFGHSNNPIGAGEFALKVPAVTFLREGDKDFQIVLPRSEAYTLTFQSQGEPIDVAVIDGIDNRTPTQAVRYLDVMLESNLKLQMAFAGNGIPDLRYDSRSNGVFDKVVEPTANLSGAAALDVDGPDLALSISFRGGLTVVTVKASDSDPGSRQSTIRWTGLILGRTWRRSTSMRRRILLST